MTFTFIVIGIFCIVALMGIALAVYSKNEKDKMRRLSLSLLQVEYGAKFEKRSIEIGRLLKSNHLNLHQSTSYIQNILRLNLPRSNGAIFETYSFNSSPTAPAGDFMGILVEYKFQSVPSFKIAQKKHLGQSNFHIIPHDACPVWLPDALAIVAHHDQADATIEFLQASPQLEEFVTDPDFVKVFFRNEFLAIYFNGRGDPLLDHFDPIIQRLKVLSELNVGGPSGDDEHLNIRFPKSTN